MKPSDTQSLVLSQASRHPERLAAAPPSLPAAARTTVFRSMLKHGLLAECAAPGGHAGLAWRQDAAGAGVALRVTEAGLRAIGADPGESAAPDVELAPQDAAGGGDRAEDLALLDQAMAAPTPTRAANLRQTAQAVLDTWDDQADRSALAGPIERLRAALTKPARSVREPGAPRKARDGTKQQQVLALLRRPEGASGPQLVEATGWAPHTVRGFLAGLGKKGIAVAVLERVRQVGPNKQGAKGSYSVYRVVEAG